MNLSLVHRDSNTIIVEWYPVPEGSENGIIEGYEVEYNIKDSGKSMSAVHEFIYYEYTAVLFGLEFDTLYTIRVAAFTRVGSGRFTEPIEVRTKMCK